MKLELTRNEFYFDRTIGGLYIDGRWCYYTLEDTDRQMEDDKTILPWSPSLKIPKQTATPYGRYQVIIDLSTRFKRKMPHLLNVPDFEGVRIHTGNYPGDTEGCILIGLQYEVGTHAILKSKLAFDDFFPRLQKGLEEGEVWLEVS